MGKTLYELKRELTAKQSAALIAIFDSVAASAQVQLELTPREAAVLSRQQMGRLWAEAREEAVAEERDKEKARYFQAEVEYADAQAKRVQEIYETVFGATSTLDVATLKELVEASPQTLDTMLTMALESGNEPVARAILHAAHERGEMEEILIRWGEEVEGGEEQLAMLQELQEVWDDDELRERAEPDRFDRLAPDEPGWADLTPTQSTPLLLR